MILCTLPMDRLITLKKSGIVDPDHWARRADEEYVRILDKIIALRTHAISGDKHILVKEWVKKKLRREIFTMFDSRNALLGHIAAINLPTVLVPFPEAELRTLVVLDLAYSHSNLIADMLEICEDVDSISVDIETVKAVNWLFSKLDDLKSMK